MPVRCTLENSIRFVAEALERRMLLSLAPVGPEFRVNTFTAGTQAGSAIAMDGNGDFVVVWFSANQDGSGNGIFAQRYNALGVPQGSEFRVNSFTTGDQTGAAVAMDADGDFVVAWQSNLQDGSGYGIHAQRFNAVGVAQGPEVRVNTFTTGDQTAPGIAMDALGNFVVTWQSNLQDGSNTGIYAQRYNVSGLPQGAEFRVNSFTTNFQSRPSVASSATGAFVVTWSSLGQDGDLYGIYAQRYNASGVAQGAEFRVNTYITSIQTNPRVAMDYSGDFVVAWQSYQEGGTPGSGLGIYAQRYNAAGVAQGPEFHVNSFASSIQSVAAVAMDADGDFLVAWQSFGQDGNGYGVYARQYNATCVPQGAEFRVNTFTTGDQMSPALAIDANGDLVVTWQSNGQDGSGYGIYAQRYDESTDTAGPIVTGVFVGGRQAFAYTVLPGPGAVSEIVVGFSEAISVTSAADWRVTHHSGSTTSNVPISNILAGLNPSTNRFEVTLQLSSGFTTGNWQLIALGSIQDPAGNALDGNLDGIPGGGASLTFSIGALAPRGPEFRANSFATGTQTNADVAIDAAGNHVVVWQSDGQDGSGLGIYAKRYDATGVPLGPDFRVNSHKTGDQRNPAVAMSLDGSFIIAWQGAGAGGAGVFFQRYDASGAANGAELFASATVTDQDFPVVATNAQGRFLVSHRDSNLIPGGGVRTRYFSSASTLIRFHTSASGADSPAVAIDADGDYLISYREPILGLRAQRFAAVNGALIGAQTVSPSPSAVAPAVANDADGNFVVAWLEGTVLARRYNSAVVAQGAAFAVSSFTTVPQRSPSVSMRSTGEFIVAWDSGDLDGDGYGIYARRFTAAGTALGVEFRVNSLTHNDQSVPAVAANADGAFVVAWTHETQPGSADTDVRAQRYDHGHTPVVAALADSPDPAPPGAPVTLTASGVSDDTSVMSVTCYRESNSIEGIQFGPGGDTLVGADNFGGDGWSVVISTASLAEGTYLYYAQAADDEGLVGAPASTTHTISTAPLVTQSEFLFLALPHRLRFMFDQHVSASLDTDDIVLQNLTTAQMIPSSQLAVSYDAPTNTATFSYTGPGSGITGVLPDGNYRATLVAAGITNPEGTPLAADHVFEFFFINGDANRDARVNLNDFNILAANFGQSPRAFSQGDFNYDTIVNLIDFNILASRFGVTLAPQETATRSSGAGFFSAKSIEEGDALSRMLV